MLNNLLWRIVLTFGIYYVAYLLAGCTVGVPEVTQLREIEGFELSSYSTKISKEPEATFSVSGKCLENTNYIAMSLDDGNTYFNADQLTAEIDFSCRQNGAFKLKFKNSKFKDFLSNGIKSLVFKAMTDLGDSRTAIFVLQSVQTDLATGGGSQVIEDSGYTFKARIQSVSFEDTSTATFKTKKFK